MELRQLFAKDSFSNTGKVVVRFKILRISRFVAVKKFRKVATKEGLNEIELLIKVGETFEWNFRVASISLVLYDVLRS